MTQRLSASRNIVGRNRIPVDYPEEAQCSMPLECNVFMSRGQWAINFTRATTAMFTDFEWYVKPVLSGEVRFQGARRVQNLYAYSQDISNAVWTPVSCVKQSNVTTAPDGTLTADRVQTNASTALMEMFQNLDVVAGKTYTYSAHVKYHNWRYIQLVGNGFTFGLGYINIDLQTGTITASSAGDGNFSWAITSVWNGWYRVSVTATCINTLAAQHLSIAFINNASDVRIEPAVWDGTSGYYIWGIQLEDVTYQSVKTPWEYVSTNVLSAPFHGANVDWVKYFDTDANWVAIPKTTLKWLLAEWTRTNICNYSDFSVSGWWLTACTRTNNAGIAPDGTNSMVKIIPNVGTQSSYAYNVSITTTAQQYTVSCYVKAAWFNFVQLRFSSSISNWYANFDLQNGVVWTMSLWTSSGIETTSIAWVYRVWAVTDTVAATTAAVAVQVVPAANSLAWASITGDWASGILAWGMQIENWLNASSYIPTTTTTATRNIDVLTYDVRNTIANQWALSLVCSMNDNALFDRRVVALSSFTIDRLHVRARALAPDKLDIAYWDGATVRSLTGVAVWTNNIAVSWTNWVWLNLYMNNIKYIGAFVPSLVFSTIDVGGGTLWLSLFWCIKNVRIWKTVPTDAELLALSNSSY